MQPAVQLASQGKDTAGSRASLSACCRCPLTSRPSLPGNLKDSSPGAAPRTVSLPMQPDSYTTCRGLHSARADVQRCRAPAPGLPLATDRTCLGRAPAASPVVSIPSPSACTKRPAPLAAPVLSSSRPCHASCSCLLPVLSARLGCTQPPLLPRFFLLQRPEAAISPGNKGRCRTRHRLLPPPLARAVNPCWQAHRHVHRPQVVLLFHVAARHCANSSLHACWTSKRMCQVLPNSLLCAQPALATSPAHAPSATLGAWLPYVLLVP